MKKVYSTFCAFLKQLSEQNIGAYASCMTFFFILALVPVVLLACGIFTYFPFSEQMLFSFMHNYFPDFLDDAIKKIVLQMYYQYQKILPFAIIILIWSAGKAVWGLKMGLNAANGVRETRFFLLIRLKASLYSVIMIVLLFCSVGMIIFTEKIAIRFRDYIPGFSNWILALGSIRFVVFWGVVVLFMALIYTFIPNKKLKFRYQLPGAVLTATAWSLFSWGFSLYLDYFHSYDVYGNLSTLIIIMVWMYTCMLMLLIGAHFNRFFEEDIKRIFDRKINVKKQFDNNQRGENNG